MENKKTTINNNNISGASVNGGILTDKHEENKDPNHNEIGALSNHKTNNPYTKLTDQTSTENGDILPKSFSKNEYKWQIIEGLKDGQRYEEMPTKYSGYILKRRKRPLKGWHKRYFILDKGILSYAKSASEMTKGKTHASIDVGLSVISTKSSSRRIDIDSDTCIFHLKVKKDDFNQWIAALKNHRLARQHEINYGNQNTMSKTDCDISNSLKKTRFSLKNNEKLSSDLFSTRYNEIEIKEHLQKIQEKLIKLSSLLKFVEVQSGSRNSSVTDLEGFKYKKHRKRFYLRKKKNHQTSILNIDQIGTFQNQNFLKDDEISLKNQNFLSLSHPSLTEEDVHNQILIKAYQNNKTETGLKKMLTKSKAMSDFILIANEINTSFRQVMKTFQDEQHRLDLFDDKNCASNSLVQSTSSDNIFHRHNSIDDYDEPTFHRNLSRYSQDNSSALSISEYYDAEDKITPSDYNSSTSSEEEGDDESVVTDFSEDGANYQEPNKLDVVEPIQRRIKLPSVQPSSDISLWSLLCKNIGKDLSKISMPVTINEPLNVLQRLCEELEYCELLDMAATIDDPYQRMLLIAAFAVSSYSSSYYRAGHKPFNPLLGETYECIREDKGFRFISEQVSHHPPISACYAESANYVFWQDMRVKSKFWGKSMEVIPFGTVNVLLKKTNCSYKWNKITTCVHNLFKGERYVDNYGELTIKDSENNTCKITFEKASYWSSKANEITGFIANSKGEIIEKIFGKWNESIHCGTRCIWRPGSMPESYQLYYGFTKFAIELNELHEKDTHCLPPTDTRFRPDQRLLEEGNIVKAEQIKLDLEQSQRERRRKREEEGLPEYIPLWFSKEVVNSDETYVFNGKYWESRDNKFSQIEFVKLW